MKETEKTLTIHWWNMGNKTLDFEGTYKDYLLKKDIKIKRITHSSYKDLKGYRFTIPLSSCVAKLDSFSNYINSCDKAIKIFLTLMEDKTKFVNAYNQEYKLNWG